MNFQFLVILALVHSFERGRVQIWASRTNNDRMEEEFEGPVPEIVNPTTSEITPVKILVTRHALSWANVAHYWMDAWQHIRFRDPLLTQIGIQKSKETGVRVKSWLESHNLTIDDVMSSRLVRAMQTAMYQYPGHTVQVVPFISEKGAGDDNVPREPKDQINRLHAQVNAAKEISLDYTWAERLADADGKMFSQKWSNFLKFLEEDYLPEFLRLRQAMGIPRSAPVVLAVATHSNFMGDADIADHCKIHYPDYKGKKKANNNQVVLLPYELTSTSHRDFDETVRYSLSRKGACLDVDQGTRDIDPDTGERRELCKTDIGEDCYEYANEKVSEYPPILEDKLKKEYWGIRNQKVDIKNLKEKIENPPPRKFSFFNRETPEQELARWKFELVGLEYALQANIKTLRSNSLKKCWIGGFPTDPEVEFGSLDENVL